MWFSTGAGSWLGSLLAVTNEIHISEVESCGGPVQERVQHFSMAFWLGTSERLSYGKGKVTRDGQCLQAFNKKTHNNI